MLRRLLAAFWVLGALGFHDQRLQYAPGSWERIVCLALVCVLLYNAFAAITPEKKND
jgi:hypothetical protein